MTGRRMVGALLTVMAICAVAAPIKASAETQSLPLRVRVDSVLAANTGKGADKELVTSGMDERLKSMFDYTTYHLVLHQELETVGGKYVTSELPGGRILQIAPHSIIENMISMELVLFEGTRPLMTTDMRLINHAVLIVGGPKYQQGMLITIIMLGLERFARSAARSSSRTAPSHGRAAERGDISRCRRITTPRRSNSAPVASGTIELAANFLTRSHPQCSIQPYRFPFSIPFSTI